MMKKKFLVAIIIGLFLFTGCSEGHKRHRGHHGYRRPVRPSCGPVRPSVHHRGPIIVISRHPSHSSRKGPYGSRRGPQGPTKGKGHGKGHGYGRGKGR